MSGALPPVAPMVVAEAVTALPNRLRKKLDAMVERAATWPVKATSEGHSVRVDGATTVELLVTDGAVREDAAARCSCLLAPACLHRAAVLSLAPVAEVAAVSEAPAPGDVAAVANGETGEEVAVTPDAAIVTAPTTGPTLAAGPEPQTTPESAAGPTLTARQRAAAQELWRAGAMVLASGVAGAGAVLRAELLRATHEARATGLYRAAEASRIVATQLQAARTGQVHYRLSELTDELRDLLGLTHRLADPDLSASEVPDLLGQARRAYDIQGSLRLFGLCTVPVVADSGYAGAITYLSDRDGRLWMAADIAPGDVGRAAATGGTAVPIGAAALTHRELSRAGLVVSGATASTTGQLGGGAAVRAVRATGAAWTEEPLTRQWQEPVADQIRRAFAALAQPVQARAAGANLLFLSIRILGPAEAGVLASTPDGAVLTLTVAADHAELPYRENLRLLAGCPGLELLLVGEPVPHRRATVHALAVGLTGSADSRISLPDRWGDHVDLGYDRLHRSQFSADGQVATTSGEDNLADGALRPAGRLEDVTSSAEISGDPALQLLRRNIERVVAGGRAVQALAVSDGNRLRRARFDTGADLLDSLLAAARNRPRDVFGRLTHDDGSRFAEAWLATAVYEKAATNALGELSWLPGDPAWTP